HLSAPALHALRTGGRKQPWRLGAPAAASRRAAGPRSRGRRLRASAPVDRVPHVGIRRLEPPPVQDGRNDAAAWGVPAAPRLVIALRAEPPVLCRAREGSVRIQGRASRSRTFDL